MAIGLPLNEGRPSFWTLRARRIRDIIPGLPISAEQFEAIIQMCRNFDQQERAGDLIKLTMT